MSFAIKISLLSSGLFLLAGMLIGILKYQRIMTSAEHRAPVYVDIAHRAAFLYSFAMLVIAKLMEFNPCSMNIVWNNFLTALLNESRLRTSNEPLTRASPLN
jgi:hypothetical protein